MLAESCRWNMGLQNTKASRYWRPVILSVLLRHQWHYTHLEEVSKLGFPCTSFLSSISVVKAIATIATNLGKLVDFLGNYQQEAKCVASLKVGATPFFREALTLESQKISTEAEISGCLDTSQKFFLLLYY